MDLYSHHVYTCVHAGMHLHTCLIADDVHVCDQVCCGCMYLSYQMFVQLGLHCVILYVFFCVIPKCQISQQGFRKSPTMSFLPLRCSNSKTTQRRGSTKAQTSLNQSTKIRKHVELKKRKKKKINEVAMTIMAH